MHKSNRRKNIRTKFKSKLKARIALFAGILALSLHAVVVACSMEIDERPSSGGAASSAIKSVDGLMVRSAVSDMIFMGGSVLYSSKNANANQLAKGVVVAVRLNDLEVTDLGRRNFAYSNSVERYQLGYIVISAISDESVSFSYHAFDNGGTNEKARPSGDFTVALGETADLNGDGKADITYTQPLPGRKGYKTDKWLTFICDETQACASMFSIIPAHLRTMCLRPWRAFQEWIRLRPLNSSRTSFQDRKAQKTSTTCSGCSPKASSLNRLKEGWW